MKKINRSLQSLEEEVQAEKDRREYEEEVKDLSNKIVSIRMHNPSFGKIRELELDSEKIELYGELVRGIDNRIHPSKSLNYVLKGVTYLGGLVGMLLGIAGCLYGLSLLDLPESEEGGLALLGVLFGVFGDIGCGVAALQYLDESHMQKKVAKQILEHQDYLSGLVEDFSNLSNQSRYFLEEIENRKQKNFYVKTAKKLYREIKPIERGLKGNIGAVKRYCEVVDSFI
ncbi:MAG: hypothetical protein ABIH72_02885 [archaeon]